MPAMPCRLAPILTNQRSNTCLAPSTFCSKVLRDSILIPELVDAREKRMMSLRGERDDSEDVARFDAVHAATEGRCGWATLILWKNLSEQSEK